ncbi:non-ribosomal peptide synthetase [Amycolatopsis rubida]|uniref:Nonribosomal peptide synthetase protein BlmVII n=1 Tax=Amycolatopsis rubida TaxID=112413 RepID=A0A1I6AIK1_9PSEU|nr:non-ribosomal peptide synthetase [Amycolatopsis rubida]SFQ68538.1 nonribosomal peptide synthetase protein BlmVII [Amycolatopsis rubida]
MNASAESVVDTPEFLAELRGKGITVAAEGDRLRCSAPHGVLTAELRAEIAARKPEILRELRDAGTIPALGRTRFPLSFGQERLWLSHRFHPEASAYNLPLRVRLTGTLAVPALRTALGGLVRRHAVLRTRYPVVDGQPVAEADPALGCPELPLVDLVGVPASRASRRMAAALATRPFDLATGPVLRAVLFRRRPEDHDLVLVRQHIASDGWSLGILLADLAELYRAHSGGTPARLAGLAVQYGDFAAWQRNRAETPEFAERLARWTAALAGAPARLDLLGRASAAETGRPAGLVRSRVGEELSGRLRRLAAQRRMTLFPVLLAGFALAVSSLAGQRDLVIGAPVAGRTRRELLPLAGCFANLLPLRIDLFGDPGFAELAARAGAVVRQGLDDQEVPFERIVEAVRPERSFADTPLVQLAFAFQNTPAPHIALPGLAAAVLPSPPVSAKFPLTMTVSPETEGLDLELEFDETRLHPATAAEIVTRTVTALEHASAEPDRPVSEIRWTAAVPSGPVAEAPAGSGCLHEEFERIAAARPDAVAVSDGGRQVSYRELDRRANGQARALRARGVGRESLVGLCARPSIDLVTGMLAILKAGAAYVPLDPADPPRRRAELAAAAGISVLLTRPEVRHAPDLGVEVLHIDGAGNRAPVRAPVSPGNLAYVVFTSGSTGAPKGVLVSHAGITSVLAGCRAALPELRGRQTWAMLHSPAFDFSAWEIWGALTGGDRLLIVPPEVVRAPDELGAALLAERVSVLSQTPGAFRALLPAAPRRGLPLSVVVFGGESCEVARLAPWFDRHGDQAPVLVNMFGITETTVHVTVRRLRQADIAGPVASPLGRALPGQRVEVLAPEGHALPVGGQGELVVSGAGVARGYLGRPGLTADRFRPGPHRPGARRYHSGDLVRVLPGDLDYLGRIDKQVSLRGFRVEPAEVEAAVLAHPGVRDCAVVPHGSGDRRQLVAYLVAEPGTTVSELSSGALRDFLSDALPRYLVPARSVVLDRIPLTRNGKLDSAALPEPPGEPDGPRGRAPVTPTERTVAGLLAEVLGWPGPAGIGGQDNFFDLGGDSLLVTRLHFRLVAEFGIDLPVRKVYQAPDVEALAATVDRLRAERRRDLVREALRQAEAAGREEAR